MVENFRAGGAAVNVLARACGADVLVVDIGVASDVAEDDVVISRKYAAATADLAAGPGDDARRGVEAIDVGIEVGGPAHRRRGRPPADR